MVDIKEAASAAERFAREALNGDLLGIRLEEVELSSDERTWLITLGWVDTSAFAGDPVKRLASGLSGYRNLPRIYKVFVVDRHTGAVQAMRIRDV